MDRKQFFFGLMLGFLLPLISVCAFSLYLGNGDISAGFKSLSARNQLPNAIRVGILANCALFTLVVTRGRDKLAQGIVVSSLLALIYSLF